MLFRSGWIHRDLRVGFDEVNCRKNCRSPNLIAKVVYVTHRIFVRNCASIECVVVFACPPTMRFLGRHMKWERPGSSRTTCRAVFHSGFKLAYGNLQAVWSQSSWSTSFRRSRCRFDVVKRRVLHVVMWTSKASKGRKFIQHSCEFRLR